MMFNHTIKKLQAFVRLVKFEHTIFALPFAMTTLLLAVPAQQWPTWDTVLCVVLAMVGGRTYAMGLNRIADACYDALNPRTANREIPTGAVTQQEAWLLTIGALALLIAAVWPLPPLCLALLPLAIALLTLYSYMKRFSSLCHLVLGLCLGSSAIGGWLAQTGQWSGGLPVLFGLGVACWVMGFDIMYACQDTAFDQQHGLHSIPARLGNRAALRWSRQLHTASVLLLLAFGCIYLNITGPPYRLGVAFWLALVYMAIQLVRQHRMVQPEDLTRVNEAFFTLNGQISLLFFSAIFMEKLLVTFWH
jgi:4-hydroxybenzoate polyprenyltransferase